MVLTSDLSKYFFQKLVLPWWNSIPLLSSRAQEIVIDRSITKDSSLWDLDEVYFLSYEKDEIILRDGNDVFYLAGMDFSDPKVIKFSRLTTCASVVSLSIHSSLIPSCMPFVLLGLFRVKNKAW